MLRQRDHDGAMRMIKIVLQKRIYSKKYYAFRSLARSLDPTEAAETVRNDAIDNETDDSAVVG
ncbi:hypothetical protein F441_04135 [Phytophthora nicotianae CJ01A1]|uniref:Uncharacterized protein n=2 Tax=Phytophthora nicotianae TaxID=4792 RepID=V9FQR7_PHYNI|nr:hypothetical protein F443_04181 [Phytophthora nicotianae P1569]ETP22597.1 hypothetical protein F441_04135 [Phytophthora nicotianae CJ01A1]